MADVEKIRRRIEQRLSDLRISKNKASREAGLDRTLLGKFLSYEIDSIKPETLRKLSVPLKCDPRYLSGEIDTLFAPIEPGAHYTPVTTHEIPIIAVAEAGVFRRADQKLNLGNLSAVVRPEFPVGQQFGVLMRDDSMVKAGILRNDELLCVNPWETGIEVAEGDWVLVDAREGKTHEVTVKELVLKRDHWELIPRSDNQAYETYKLAPGDDLQSGRISVIGIVISIHRHRQVRRSARGQFVHPYEHPSDETPPASLVVAAANKLSRVAGAAVMGLAVAVVPEASAEIVQLSEVFPPI